MSIFTKIPRPAKMMLGKSLVTIFAIIFVTMNGHTHTLYKNILNDVQIKDKGEINMAQRTYSKNILILYQLKGFKCSTFYFFRKCVLPSNNVN